MGQPKSTKSFLKAVHGRTAIVSIASSTVRGQPAGTVAAAREFLTGIRLASFATEDESAFVSTLNTTTSKLMDKLPKRNWGVARKCLNIFLRDALYNVYLRDDYGLALAEKFYEVPLDKYVATELKKRSERGQLPAWPGVKHLDPTTSERFQRFAQTVALRRKIARVHLDAIFWTERKQSKK